MNFVKLKQITKYRHTLKCQLTILEQIKTVQHHMASRLAGTSQAC